MTSAVVTSDVFKFLDIRPATRLAEGERRYLIERSDLEFPETHFEKSLRSLKRDSGYQAALKALSNTRQNDARPTQAEGFDKRVEAITATLRLQSAPPEEMLAKLLHLVPPAAERVQKLIEPAQDVWDRYLAATITGCVAGPHTRAEQDKFVLFATRVRGAALLFALKDSPDLHLMPSQYLMASIRVDPELVDVAEIARQRPEAERGSGDRAARNVQNQAVDEVVRLELALDELSHVLATWRRPPPAAAAGADTTADGSATIATAVDEIELPLARFSASTRQLLVSDYGAAEAGGKISGFNLVRSISDIDDRLRRAGARLFQAAPSHKIVEAGQQLTLLRETLRQAADGKLDPDRIARMPLMLPAPLLGERPALLKLAPASVRPLGVGDLKIVKQTLLRYDLGEVAHIENVLEGQTKERLHSVKKSTEETFLISTEKSASVEKDLQTTDRFELAEETENTIKRERQNETGVTVTASYGAVSMSANTRFEDTSSQEQTSKVSRKFARDVVSRSVEKIEQRVREERTRKTTLQIEETSRYTQSAKDKNIVGIYRWVEKIYSAQVHVYGKRMMLEFLVPEPAAVFLKSRTIRPTDPGAIRPPDSLNFGPTDITRSNYTSLAALYGAQVEAPPPAVQEVRMVARASSETAATKITLEDGWIGVSAAATGGWVYRSGAWMLVQIAHAQWLGNAGTWWPQNIGDVSGEVPVTVITNNVVSFNVVASVTARPSERLMEKWQLDTYSAIRDAYELRLSEYRDYLASQRQAEIDIEQKQDAESRAIERRELQRGCIELMTQQHFDSFGAIQDNPATGWPEILFPQAAEQGQRAAYFQQSFEWEQMTYVFYPYFWGRQSEWTSKVSGLIGDALFSRFLSSGFARVVVPVRPAHETDVAYFLATGVIWQGSEPPTVGDPRYVDIVEEIKESLDAPDGGRPEGAAWHVKIPTSLVLLDSSDELPSWPDQANGETVFKPSQDLCRGIAYNLAQWPDAAAILAGIRALGYAIADAGNPKNTLRENRPGIRAMQVRFNQLGIAAVIGEDLDPDGIAGPCTLRALSYFTALLNDNAWPGVG